MRASLTGALVGALLLGAPALAVAQNPPEQQAEQAVPGEQHSTQQGSGELQGRIVGVRGNVMALDTGQGQPVMVVVKDTQQVPVRQGNRALSFDQLREGQRVRARFRVEGQTRVATGIEVTPSPQTGNGPG